MPKTKLMREVTTYWPPIVLGHDGTWRYPIAGEGVVKGVFPVQDKKITFDGEFETHPFKFHLEAPTEKIASQIHGIIAVNCGRTVAEIGECKLEIE